MQIPFSTEARCF